MAMQGLHSAWLKLISTYIFLRNIHTYVQLHIISHMYYKEEWKINTHYIQDLGSPLFIIFKIIKKSSCTIEIIENKNWNKNMNWNKIIDIL